MTHQPVALQHQNGPENGPAALLHLDGLCKKYGAVTAVAPLDLSIGSGDFFAILGPSGCGKTTLLRMIGGFVQPTSGKVVIQGRDVTLFGPERRPTNMVFQGYGLFPHMTVHQNIAYGLKIAGLPRPTIDARLAEVMRLVRLEALSERSIAQLSGGQQQRVALARALVMRPPVLLLDEPLAALDLKLRQAMQEELRRIHAEIGGTFVFVTHDQGEAMSLANRVAVMSEGRLLQVGSPEEIYGSPQSEFVATFIGEANLFRGERRNGIVKLPSGPQLSAGGPDGPVTLVVRPEAMVIDPPVDGRWLTVRGMVVDRVFLGPTVRLAVRLADGQPVLIQATDPGSVASREPGTEVTIGWPVSRHSILQG